VNPEEVPTQELGHDGRIDRRRRNPDGRDVFGASDVPATAVDLRCGAATGRSKVCARELGKVWNDEGVTTVRLVLFGHTGQWSLREVVRESDHTIGVHCPQHGVARVHEQVLVAAASSTRRFLRLDVTAGRIG
jgi:hypothetical protein